MARGKRLTEKEFDEIKKFMEAYPTLGKEEIAKTFGYSKMLIYRIVRAKDYVDYCNKNFKKNPEKELEEFLNKPVTRRELDELLAEFVDDCERVKKKKSFWTKIKGLFS